MTNRANPFTHGHLAHAICNVNAYRQIVLMETVLVDGQIRAITDGLRWETLLALMIRCGGISI